MNFLSVIIPVYNVRNYLIRCVNSVVSECNELAYEILLVDDGSTDGSGDLCDEMAAQLPKVKVLHKLNGGLSDARNYGIEHATGEYVFYLDSDDYLVENGLKTEIEVAKRTSSDVVCGNFYYKYSNHVMLFNNESYGTLTFEGGEESLRILIKGNYYQNFAWGKLIRRELAEKFFFPKGKLFEDTYWFHNILHCANRVTVVDVPVVYYEQRDGSISFEYKLRSLDILDGYTERLHFFESHYPKLVDGHKLLMVQNCIEHAWMVCRYLKKDDYYVAIKKIRDTIVGCNLQDCVMLKGSQRKKLRMIMISMAMYKYSTMFEKVIKKIVR
ncbi:glycosyltransferase family 2 protein [Bacteroides sp.]|uniref:glycosyltransferase family 2 protein n=1 Tax=Bacteroides sp. TaxID=29523 RepID=UPI0025BA28F4|nr:glycosyltransferase family 2 protein [Bacteroides sp.]